MEKNLFQENLFFSDSPVSSAFFRINSEGWETQKGTGVKRSPGWDVFETPDGVQFFTFWAAVRCVEQAGLKLPSVKDFEASPAKAVPNCLAKPGYRDSIVNAWRFWGIDNSGDENRSFYWTSERSGRPCNDEAVAAVYRPWMEAPSFRWISCTIAFPVRTLKPPMKE